MKTGVKSEGLVFYPNPVTSVLHIDVNDRKYDATFDVHIFNQKGEFIKGVKNHFFNNIAIKVDDLPPGFYTLKTDNDNSMTRNFVIR